MEQFGFTGHLSGIGMQVLQNNVIPGTTGLQLSTVLHSQGTFKAQHNDSCSYTMPLGQKLFESMVSENAGITPNECTQLISLDKS